MRVVIDSQALLWFAGNIELIPPVAREMLESGDHDLFVSIASIWELSIKVGIGKLVFPLPFEKFVREQLEEHEIKLLEISVIHALKAGTLPLHHKDPFDRMIASQCLEDDLTLISSDAIFDRYGVKRIW